MALVGRRVVLFAGLVVCTGCVDARLIRPIEQGADAGQPITEEQAVAKAKDYLATTLKDPGSAQYKWLGIRPASIGFIPLAFNKRVNGYVLSGLVNAKNSYGGYTGFKLYQFAFRNGLLIQIIPPDSEL
jgi:hypothetical protein